MPMHHLQGLPTAKVFDGEAVYTGLPEQTGKGTAEGVGCGSEKEVVKRLVWQENFTTLGRHRRFPFTVIVSGTGDIFRYVDKRTFPS